MIRVVITLLAERTRAAVPAVIALGLVVGAASGARPTISIGVAVGLGSLLLAFRAPTANLVALVFLTAVVPYGLQNQFGVGGGAESPGLLLSDLLLLAGLTWAVLGLSAPALRTRELVVAVGILAFLCLAILQFVHGLNAGSDRSRAGAELRAVLGFGTFLIALPLLTTTRSRRRLMAAMLVVAIALGGWGLIQWLGNFSFGAAGDVGVRSGVRLTSSGTGQLQGGEYGFPVMIVTCFSVLIASSVRSTLGRASLLLALALNAVACLLTFERTFWIASLAGMGVVLLKAHPLHRAKALFAAPLVLVLAVGSLAVASPKTLTTAGERIVSVGSYSRDDSVRYRLTESRFVLAKVRAHPVAGSGLGGTIFWGQPWAQVPPKSYAFSHDGYLWLAWKLGVPAAALLVLLLGGALFVRDPRGDDELSRSVRHGAQGALVSVLVATIAFPSLSQLSITPMIGVLLALAICRAEASR